MPGEEGKKIKRVMCLNVKGGTGKTLIAINLAMELSKKYKVSLVDLDLDSSNTAGLLGLSAPIDVDISSRKLVPIEYDGMKVIAMSLFLPKTDMGVCIPDGQRAQFIYEAISNTEWGDIGYMIFDMPGSSSIEFTTLVRAFDDCQAIIVTQPNTLEDCNRVIDLCMHFKIKILGIVENMSGSYMHGYRILCPCNCGKEFAPFGSNTVEEAYKDVRFLGKIPLCYEIFESKPPRIPEEFDVIKNIVSLLEA